jgi:hypothetical protein
MNKIFVSTEEDHAVGRYTARLWVQGGWKNVTVDDRIPCADDSLPCFASCTDIDECWVPILEKVFAKHFGSYSNLEATNLYKISYQDPLEMLTGGFKAGCYKPENTIQAWNRLHSLFRNDTQRKSCHVAYVCRNNTGDSKAVSLVSTHAYSLVRTIELSGGTKLVQLRNPWGNVEFSGAWSDDSSEWTYDLRKEVNDSIGDDTQCHYSAIDGTFFMSFEDFCKYWRDFTFIRIMHKEKEYKKVIVRGHWKDATERVILFEVVEDTEVTVTLTQPESEYTYEKCPKEHSLYEVIINKHGADRKEIVYGSNDELLRLTEERFLPKGKYTCTIKGRNCLHTGYEVTFYSKKPINVTGGVQESNVEVKEKGEDELMAEQGYVYTERRDCQSRINGELAVVEVNVVKPTKISLHTYFGLPENCHCLLELENLQDGNIIKSEATPVPPTLQVTIPEGPYLLRMKTEYMNGQGSYVYNVPFYLVVRSSGYLNVGESQM